MKTPHDVLRRTTALLAGLVVAASLSGCVSMPHGGPVVEADSKGQIDQQLGYYNDPPPPTPGETPPEIVKHFLDAMAANPIQVSTAKLFLSKQAATTWQPFERTITYVESTLPEGVDRVGVTSTTPTTSTARARGSGRCRPPTRVRVAPKCRARLARSRCRLRRASP